MSWILIFFAISRQFLSKIFSSDISFRLVTFFKETYLLISVSLKRSIKNNLNILKILKKKLVLCKLYEIIMKSVDCQILAVLSPQYFKQ